MRNPELELRVGDDDPASFGVLGCEAIEGERRISRRAKVLLTAQRSRAVFVDVLVVTLIWPSSPA